MYDFLCKKTPFLMEVLTFVFHFLHSSNDNCDIQVKVRGFLRGRILTMHTSTKCYVSKEKERKRDTALG